ncbi:MAG TPA: TetR family transcriptional regulator [Polyangia bacterium]|nr:TetR family transcriptional regulator [Polyangia bacterium]
MARPAQADSEATRQKLIDIALPIFARFGYLGASTRGIAQEAKLNGALINHYFGGKRNLYEACVDDVYRRLSLRIGRELQGITPTDLELLMTKLYAAARAERDGVRLLVREVLDLGHLTPFTESKHYLPELADATRNTARLIGVPAETARTAAIAMGYMISRYVIQDDKSLVTAFGVRSVKEAHARVVTTLVTTLRALLGRPHHH